MKRRTIIKGALIAGVFAAIPCAEAKGPAGTNDWLLIADGSDNLNRHAYSSDALAIMAGSAKGVPVQEDDVEIEPRLDKIIGIVSESKLEGSRVFVKVRWFTGRKPSSGFVVPNGEGQINKIGETIHVGADYRLCSFSWNQRSAFREATQIA